MTNRKELSNLTERITEIRQELEQMRDDSRASRNYIFRKVNLSLSAEKEDSGWLLKGELILTVSEESESKEDAHKGVPLNIEVKDSNFDKAMAVATSALYALPAEYGDAIFEEGFFDLLDEYADLNLKIAKLERDKGNPEGTFVTGFDSETIVQ